MGPAGPARAGPRRRPSALAELAQVLRRTAATTHPGCGPVGDPAATPVPDLPGFVLERALRHVRSAAALEPRIAAVADEVRHELRERHARILPRAGSSLVHGELGPDHVRLDSMGHPVLIDVEGAAWVDVEWEHAFLELRFGSHYDPLRVPGLDEDRLQAYRLAHHVSLVEGPLRLVRSGFPDPGGLRAIAAVNTERVLASLHR